MALAEWEEEQRRNPDAAGALPKRVASVKAEAFMEEHTSGDAHGAGSADEAGSASAGRKRRKVAQYAGLGNLDEDENDDVTCKICRVEFSTVEEKVCIHPAHQCLPSCDSSLPLSWTPCHVPCLMPSSVLSPRRQPLEIP